MTNEMEFTPIADPDLVEIFSRPGLVDLKQVAIVLDAARDMGLSIELETIPEDGTITAHLFLPRALVSNAEDLHAFVDGLRLQRTEHLRVKP